MLQYCDDSYLFDRRAPEIKRCQKRFPSMRVSVFSRGSNPAIDRRIQRKSLSYAAEQVEIGMADWVDSLDHAKGIICREFLYSGERLVAAAPESLTKLARPRRCPLPPLEVGNARFEDPQKNQAIRDERNRLVATARAIAFFGTPLELVQQLTA
jgi:hypothetical protein